MAPPTRGHRGPHPRDEQLFGQTELETLRAAVHDLSWLRTRGYAEKSAIKLVGDRYQLRARQRVAVGRCACADGARLGREARRIDPPALEGHTLVIDGLNVLTTIEVALAGGVLLLGRDGCMRDMASFHGNYRLVQETERAVTVLLEAVELWRPSYVRVFIDRPVSNSGRLAAAIRAEATRHEMPVEAILSPRVDRELKSADGIVATADSAVLDVCGPWLNLARSVVEQYAGTLDRCWLLDLGTSK